MKKLIQSATLAAGLLGSGCEKPQEYTSNSETNKKTQTIQKQVNSIVESTEDVKYAESLRYIENKMDELVKKFEQSEILQKKYDSLSEELALIKKEFKIERGHLEKVDKEGVDKFSKKLDEVTFTLDELILLNQGIEENKTEVHILNKLINNTILLLVKQNEPLSEIYDRSFRYLHLPNNKHKNNLQAVRTLTSEDYLVNQKNMLTWNNKELVNKLYFEYLLQANAFIRSNDLDKAVLAYENIINLSPNNTDTVINYENFHSQLANHKEAPKIYKQALSLTKDVNIKSSIQEKINQFQSK